MEWRKSKNPKWFNTHIWGGHFKPHSDDLKPTYGGRNFIPHLDDSTSTYGVDTSNPKVLNQVNHQKFPTSQWGDASKPHILETNNLVKALNIAALQTPNEEDEVLKQL